MAYKAAGHVSYALAVPAAGAIVPCSRVLHFPVPSDHAPKAPVGPGWVHEIKHDGYRLQIHLREGRVRLFTRTEIDWTDRYPWIVEDVARLPAKQAIIDAECCVGVREGGEA